MKNKAFAVLAAIGCLLFASTAFADQPMPWQKGLQPAATSIMEEVRWFAAVLLRLLFFFCLIPFGTGTAIFFFTSVVAGTGLFLV